MSCTRTRSIRYRSQKCAVTIAKLAHLVSRTAGRSVGMLFALSRPITSHSFQHSTRQGIRYGLPAKVKTDFQIFPCAIEDRTPGSKQQNIPVFEKALSQTQSSEKSFQNSDIALHAGSRMSSKGNSSFSIATSWPIIDLCK